MNHILERDVGHVILNALQEESNIHKTAIQIYINLIALDYAKIF